MHHIMAKFWWILAVRGALGILLGSASFVWFWGMNSLSHQPVGPFALGSSFSPVVGLILLLSLYAFLDGLFSVLLGIQDYGGGRRWWALIVEGVFSAGMGALAWIWPE